MINVALLPTQSYLKCLEILFLENFCQILPKLSHIWNKIYRLVIPKLTIFFQDEDYRSCYERKHRQIVCLQEKKIFFSSLINSFMGLPGLPHSVSVLCTTQKVKIASSTKSSQAFLIRTDLRYLMSKTKKIQCHYFRLMIFYCFWKKTVFHICWEFSISFASRHMKMDHYDLSCNVWEESAGSQQPIQPVMDQSILQ